MTKQERHSWSFPTAEGLARGLGIKGLREEQNDGVVSTALKAFTDAVKTKIGSVSGSDFAMEVAQSKGDLTKVQGYAALQNCIAQLEALDRHGGLGKPMRVIKRANELLLANKAAFQDAFRGQAGTGRYVYIGAVIALYASVSLVIAEAITWQEGNDGVTPIVVPAGVDSVAGSLPLTRLEGFVARAEKAGFAKELNEQAPVVEAEILSEVGIIPGFMLGAAAIVFLAWFARDVVEWYFAVRRNFSRWLDLQAKFLELNALRLQGGRAAGPRKKQEEYARTLRTMADVVRVEDKDGSKDAVREIQAQDRDIARAVEDGSEGGGALV